MKIYKNYKRAKSSKKSPKLQNTTKAKTKIAQVKSNKTTQNYQSFGWVIYIAIALFLLFGSIWLNQKNNTNKIIISNNVKEPVFRVETSKLESFKYVKKLIIYGSSRAYRTLTLIPEIDAKVKEIKVREGDEIYTGDILIELAKPQYKSLLNEAKISVDNSKLEYRSMKSLYANKLASKREMQKSKAIYEEDKAKLKIAQDNLASLTITAPFNSKIEEIYVELGQVVSSYSTPLLKIIEDNRLIITGFLAESKVNDLLIGDSAKVYFSNNSEADGEIIFIAGDADPDTRTFKVEVLISNPTNYFRSGMTARIEIPYDKVKAYEIKPSYLTLNAEGIIGIKYVENFKVRFAAVEILEENNNKMIITNLPNNLPIITIGHGFIREGDFVKVTEANK